MSFGLLDYLLVGIYFLAVLYVGFRAGKKESSEGYLIAGRNLGAWESAITICASKTGAGMMLAYFAFVYMYGFSAMWYFAGFIVGYAIFYFFAKRLKNLADKHKYYTLADYFFHCHGKKTGLAVGILALFTYLILLASQFVGGAKILVQLSNVSYGVSLTIMAAVIITYICVGGFKSVVRTDILQYVAMLSLILLFALFMGRNYSYLPADFDFLNLPITVLVAFFVVGILLPFTSMELWQRVYATKSARHANRSLLIAMGVYFVFGLLLSFVGVVVRNAISIADPDLALVAGFQALLPVGLLGLGAVVLYAAVMSSADTYLFSSSAMAIQDIYDRITKKNKKLTVYRLRWASFMIGLGAYVFSFFIRDLVIAAYLYLAFGVTISLAVLLSWVAPRTSQKVLISGIVGGAIVVVVAFVFIQSEILVFAGLFGAFFGMSLGYVWQKLF